MSLSSLVKTVNYNHNWQVKITKLSYIETLFIKVWSIQDSVLFCVLFRQVTLYYVKYWQQSLWKTHGLIFCFETKTSKSQILIFVWSRFKNFNVANILLNKILYHNFFITTVKNNNIKAMTRNYPEKMNIMYINIQEVI
jgi:hypothetical protein